MAQMQRIVYSVIINWLRTRTKAILQVTCYVNDFDDNMIDMEA
jgi:hypothetical protein